MVKEIKKPDILIIGAGPAGLTASIYAARLKLETLILEDELVGGQIRDAYIVENYPGISSIGGGELADRMREQSISTGVDIDEFDRILAVTLTANEKIIETESCIYQPQALIIAAGMKKKELPIPEEKTFHGNGIHYCELCDGHLYEGKEIAVIGGGSAAVGAALALTKYATKVTVINRSSVFRADKADQEKLFSNPKIEVIWNAKVVGASGDKKLQALVLEDKTGNSMGKITVDGAFIYIGSSPRTAIYAEDINMDGYGNIIAGESCETNIPGVFVAGDVRTKVVRQLTTAVSDGTIAAIMAEQYIMNLARRN